jgi:hypothetical protein
MMISKRIVCALLIGISQVAPVQAVDAPSALLYVRCSKLDDASWFAPFIETCTKD